MPDIEKAQRREARSRRLRYGQRGQARWWHAVAHSQARRARLLEERATRRYRSSALLSVNARADKEEEE